MNPSHAMRTLPEQDRPPEKLAHLVFKSRDKKAMMDWYATVLLARTVFDNHFIGFLSFDDEHHRVAVIEIPSLSGPAPAASGLHHVAFTYSSLGDLLRTFVRLRDAGIMPHHSLNHGPTTSIYYTDPDGNRVELQIDNFADMEEATAWLSSPEFEENPIGANFEPEALLSRYLAGEPEADLKRRPNVGPRSAPSR
ncbi:MULTISPECIES: VOC family protein [unclassified Variovorax]|uniref:VOC family protein n=1 Tax=unclassified Variovorax TaxID=663243 RepID=UPI001BD48049|nr:MULTISPECIES: VOC family protein [unclassified Variovorax]